MGAVDLKQASKFGVDYTIYTYKTTPSNWSLKTTNFSILHQILMSSSLNNLHSRLEGKLRIRFVSHETKTPNTFCWEFLKISPLHIFWIIEPHS